jgi:hypothetical protein
MRGVYQKLTLIIPDHFACYIVAASVKQLSFDKFVIVNDPAKLIDIFAWMFNGNLMHRVSLCAWHMHRDEKLQDSLLTTVPSIRFFHLELRPPGNGFLDFNSAPM